MPALALDAAFVHVNRADTHGNGQLLGPDPFFDELFLGAADRRFVTAEKVVEPGRAHSTRARSRPSPISRLSPTPWPRRPAAPTSRRARPTTTATRLPEGLRVGGRRPPTPGRRSPRRYLEVDEAGYQARGGARRRVADERVTGDATRRHPGRGVRGGVRRGLARRRRGRWPAPSAPSRARGPPGPAHLRARPRPHRRRGRAHGQHAVGVRGRRRARARGVDALPAGVRRGVVGPAPHHDDGHAGGPLRQPELSAPSATGPGPRPSSSGSRGAPGNTLNHTTSYWVPAHSPAQLRRARRHGVRRRLRPGRGGRARRPRASTRSAVVVSNLGVFDFDTPDHAMRLRSVHPGVTRRRGRRGHRLRAGRPRRRRRRPRLPDAEELELIREVLDPDPLRDKEVRDADATGAVDGPRPRRHARAPPGAAHPAVRAGRRALPDRADGDGLGGRAPPGGRHGQGRRRSASWPRPP